MPRKTLRRKQEISSPRQILVLASPVRQDILDTVAAAGPCSVADLARLLGMPADGLYYHIRSLSLAGLLKLTSAKGKRGRGEARLPPERAGRRQETHGTIGSPWAARSRRRCVTTALSIAAGARSRSI